MRRLRERATRRRPGCEGAVYARSLGDPASPPQLRLTVRVLQVVVWMHIHVDMRSCTSNSLYGGIASKIYCSHVRFGVQHQPNDTSNSECGADARLCAEKRRAL